MVVSALAARLARPLSAIVLSALCLALAGCGINTIPTYEQDAKAAWSEVLNQYKRRADLIPNLVESVKGFADQERTVLTDVVNARAKATQVTAQIPPDILTNPEAMQKLQDAQSQLGGALGRLLAVVERYPDIKSGQNFLALQSEIEGTENRIARARAKYIDSVRAYNTEITTFPGRIWRAVMYPSAKEMATFDIAADEMKTPKVDFSKPK
jgi:LemA protein